MPAPAVDTPAVEKPEIPIYDSYGIVEHPDGYLMPKGTGIRVVSMPARTLVTQIAVKRATKRVTVPELDIGMYMFSAHWFDPVPPKRGMKFIGAFLVGVDEEQWKRIGRKRPVIVKPMLTSEGTVWNCKYPGCDDQMGTQISAYVHQCGHWGIDPLEKPEDSRKADVQAHNMALKMGEEAEKKKPKG